MDDWQNDISQAESQDIILLMLNREYRWDIKVLRKYNLSKVSLNRIMRSFKYTETYLKHFPQNDATTQMMNISK